MNFCSHLLAFAPSNFQSLSSFFLRALKRLCLPVRRPKPPRYQTGALWAKVATWRRGPRKDEPERQGLSQRMAAPSPVSSSSTNTWAETLSLSKHRALAPKTTPKPTPTYMPMNGLASLQKCTPLPPQLPSPPPAGIAHTYTCIAHARIGTQSCPHVLGYTHSCIHTWAHVCVYTPPQFSGEPRSSRGRGMRTVLCCGVWLPLDLLPTGVF